MDNQTKEKVEAAVFRRLMEHMQHRTDAQNIDLMGLAGFCRNCFAKWYAEAASEQGIDLDKDESREIIYGMPYKEWTENHQTEATEEQLQKMQESLLLNKK